MTAGDRLRLLAGTAGAAGALLLLIGTGSTAGAALVNYSKLGTETAAVHLMTDISAVKTGGGWVRPPRRVPVDEESEEDEALLISLRMM